MSKKTVSRVLNKSPFVSAETRQKVEAIIERTSYSPDPQARGLAFRRSFLVGMVFDNPNPQYVVNMQHGILDGLRGTGFELVIHPCDRLSRNYLATVRDFAERRPHGGRGGIGGHVAVDVAGRGVLVQCPGLPRRRDPGVPGRAGRVVPRFDP